MDTIFALSTASGKAGVAVIRISGDRAFVAVETLAGSVPPYRKAALRALRSPDGVLLDQALIIAFPEGQSFTGEPTVEIQCHGSMAVVAAILEALGHQDGLRPASPGEFTRRALENEKLDLAQVEGLADLIEAETEAQRQQALRVLSGELGDKAEAWRNKLIRSAALLEATIDFADEEVPEDVSPEVIELLDSVLNEIDKEISGIHAAERIREGFEVAIVGAPNIGKSTLLNALAGRDAAITSEIAGTTRDVIEVRMDLKGLPVTLLDTAGLRQTDDKVEAIGVDRARQRAFAADLRVVLIAPGEEPEFLPQEGDLVLFGKADLFGEPENSVSGKTGHGIQKLVDQITERLNTKASGAGLATRMRHRHALESGKTHLEQARHLVEQSLDMTDIAAEELRSAIWSLDSLVGRIDIENVLDEIFSSFCLGK